MSKILIIITFIFLGLYGFLVYQNYKSPKLFENLPILLGAILAFTFVIIQTDNSISGDIHSKFFSDSKGTYSLNFVPNPTIRTFFTYHNNLSVTNESQWNLNESEQSSEFVAFAILSFIFNYNSGDWSNNRNKKDIVYIKPDGLSKDIMKSRFFKGFEFTSQLRRISLPKGSRISLEKLDFATHRIKISKDYLWFKDYEIVIDVKFRRRNPGLDEFEPFFGIDTPGSKTIDLNNDISCNYASHSQYISFKADFSRIRPWSPEVLSYKEWSKQMLSKLDYQFNWDKNLIKFKDYMQATANEIIIQKNK